MATVQDLLRLLQEAPQFVQNLLAESRESVPWLAVNPSAPLDHICLRVGSADEYPLFKQSLETLGAVLLTEHPVGGRPIATYKLSEEHAIHVEDPLWPGDAGEFGSVPKVRSIRVLELPSPKPGRFYATGWEHVEVAVGGVISGVALEEVVRGAVAMGDAERDAAALACLNKFSGDALNAGVVYDESAMKKGGFNIDLRFSGKGWAVKFHWIPLEHVIAIETKKD
ncbi:hypothetical protein HDU81_006786 [Chytriomyces hyalinus]|nr:hypothetical protein HDU81_006786 [Chytriomyces hyalinus]